MLLDQESVHIVAIPTFVGSIRERADTEFTEILHQLIWAESLCYRRILVTRDIFKCKRDPGLLKHPPPPVIDTGHKTSAFLAADKDFENSRAICPQSLLILCFDCTWPKSQPIDL